MKKSLIALAVMAASGAAMAQSSVTLFGIVDVTVRHLRADGAGNQTILSHSGYNTARLGFRGTEDLGGGMKASFWLEAGHQPDDGRGQATSTNNAGGTTGGGGLTFNRRSTVSLSSGFGEVRLGRDYVPTFWNYTIFDPFGTTGVGSSLNVNATTGVPTFVRASNSIGYFLPANLGGFYGQVMYAFGEGAPDTANEDDGRYVGLRLGYGTGPFNVAFAWGRTEYDATSALGGDYRAWNIGGSWDLGMAKILARYSRDEIDEPVLNGEQRAWLIGALVPVGAGEIRASYTDSRVDTNTGEPRARQFALGYVHNLSKRTALYATYSRLSNRDNGRFGIQGFGPANAGGDATGLDLGVRHSF